MDKGLRIIIAGGGTGGHLFPGIAIAREFGLREPSTEVVFVGTDRVFEKSVLSDQGFRHRSISAAGIKGRRWWQKLYSVLKVPKGILQSLWILLTFRPHLVVGVGGYSAGPVVLAAWLLRIRRVLHEQNVLPGITNRMLSRFSDGIFVSFGQTETYFGGYRVMVTGNPVRHEILEVAVDTAPADRTERPFSVLITGGSQGAHSINQAMLDALDHLEQKDRFCFIHQTGADDTDWVQEGYRKLGSHAVVQPFFKDMAARFKEADLIICRAGATTVAEITALGKAAIFIPYPHAADNHQMLNAKDLQAAGAAEMILEKDLTGIGLAETIERHAAHPNRLRDMEKRAKSLGMPDAAQTIVNECYRLMKIRT